MLHNLHLSIYYPVAIVLLMVTYLMLFSEKVHRPPVFYLSNGLVLYSDVDSIPVGSKLNKPYCPASLANPKQATCSLANHQQVEVETIEFGANQIIHTFYIAILISFLFCFFIVWFVEMSHDYLIALCFFWLTAFTVQTLHLLIYNSGALAWMIIGSLVPINILNVNLRISGYIVNARILIGEAIVLIFLSTLIVLAKNDAHIIRLLLFVFWVLIFVSLAIQIYSLFDRNNDKLDQLKKTVATSGIVIGVALPVFFFLYLPLQVPGLVFLIAVALFPISLIYGTYRMQLLPFQFFITRSIADAALTFTFLFIYAVVIYISSMAVPDTDHHSRWVVNVVLLLVLVFFLDSFRTRISAIVDKQFLLPKGEHSESLKRLAEIISRSSRPRVAVQAILDEINQTLNLQRSFFLTSPDFFFYLDLKEQNVIRIPNSSLLWNLLQPEKMQFASYLLYGTGIRKELFEFLFHRRIIVAIGLGHQHNLIHRFREWLAATLPKSFQLTQSELTENAPRCAFLAGYPEGRDKLYLHELRYLQEATRLAGMMLLNMHALIKEVDNRRKVRDLQQSGHYQKLYTLNPDPAGSGIDYRFFNRPVLSVTGDYIDIVRLDTNRVAVFLGDVSGHGLGTGFLVSALRSIVRTTINAGKNLSEILGILNDFLSDRYNGYEFLTLFAMVIHTNDGHIDYINAAHPGAFLKLPGQPLEKLENTQRLLGVLPGPYINHTIQTEPGLRIFLFSDGVLESANPRFEFYGENRLQEYLSQSGDLPLDDIVNGLRDSIDSFRGSAPPNDDTSFLVVEYLPVRSMLETVLRSLGWRR